jgi:LAO/AO transport system kinase
MLALVMPRDGWHPPVIRTIATDNQGINLVAAAITKFRAHFESGSERSKKHTEHWRNRLLELLEARILERVLNAAGGEAALNQLAADVAERRTDPFAAVNQLLSKSGLGPS